MPRDDDRITDRPGEEDRWDDDDQLEGGRVRHRDIRKNRFSNSDLRWIAICQKIILLAILLYLGAVVAQYALPPELRPFLFIPVLPAALAATVFVFMLSIKLYGTGLGVVFGLLAMVPCLGFFILLIVNAKATDTLKRHGHKVGLLGASLSDFKGPGE